jgi:hypothetical protein
MKATVSGEDVQLRSGRALKKEAVYQRRNEEHEERKNISMWVHVIY